MDQLLLVLQTLLQVRFKLSLHRGQKELAVLALAAGKRAPKFHAAAENSDASGNKVGLGCVISNRISMPLLATLLSRFLREPVLDLTGLKGWYEIKLEWTPDTQPLPAGAGAEPREAAAAPDTISVFAAVEEQLGLKLERHKGPLEVLVVDHAERVPVENYSSRRQIAGPASHNQSRKPTLPGLQSP